MFTKTSLQRVLGTSTKSINTTCNSIEIIIADLIINVPITMLATKLLQLLQLPILS